MTPYRALPLAGNPRMTPYCALPLAGNPRYVPRLQQTGLIYSMKKEVA